MGVESHEMVIRMHVGDFVKTLVIPLLIITAVMEVTFNSLLNLGRTRELGSWFLLVVGPTVPAILGLAFLIVFLAATVYEIRVGTEGVGFRYLFSRPFSVRWNQILPPKYPYKGRTTKISFGGIAFGSLSTAPGVKKNGWGVSDKLGDNMPLWVSKEQALSILFHPSAPAWRLSMEIWKSLGVNSPPPEKVSS